MNTGTYISGIGHVVLIGWAIVGSVLSQHQPAPKVQITDVSVISKAAFLAMTSSVPRAETKVNQPSAPSQNGASPDVPTPENKPRLAGFTAPDTPASPGTSPDLKDVVTAPVTDAQITSPDMAAPDTTDQSGVTLMTPDAPVSNRDQNGMRAPDKLALKTPLQQPAPRVDTTPAPRQPSDAKTSDQTVHATRPDKSATVPVDKAVEQAPKQASSEIVTEAKQKAGSSAPIRSRRPKGRPARLAKNNTTATAIQKALAQAQVEAAASGKATHVPKVAPSGPPLTGSEKDGLRLSVQKCWNVGSLSSDAMRVTVTVGVSLGRDGKILAGSVHLISSTDPSNSASGQAYEAARRAIIRCGAKGFDLPVKKYDHWRDIEMTFNPEKMRIK